MRRAWPPSVAAMPLDVDHVPLRDVRQPGPACLHLDEALVSAFQRQAGAYRPVPVVDEQRRPTALGSMPALMDELVAALPHEPLHWPASAAHAMTPTPAGASGARSPRRRRSTPALAAAHPAQAHEAALGGTATAARRVALRNCSTPARQQR